MGDALGVAALFAWLEEDEGVGTGSDAAGFNDEGFPVGGAEVGARTGAAKRGCVGAGVAVGAAPGAARFPTAMGGVLGASLMETATLGAIVGVSLCATCVDAAAAAATGSLDDRVGSEEGVPLRLTRIIAKTNAPMMTRAAAKNVGSRERP